VKSPGRNSLRRLTSIGAVATDGVASEIRPEHDRKVQHAIDPHSGTARDASRAPAVLIVLNSLQQ